MRAVEQVKYVTGLQPVDANATAKTADYVSMKNYRFLSIIINYGVAAAGTPAITLTQATTVAGADAKTLGFSFIWVNGDTAVTDTLVKIVVAANSYSKIAGSNQKLVIQIDRQDLDIQNDFDVVRVNTSTPGANATLMNIDYELMDARYEQTTPPSAIVD